MEGMIKGGEECGPGIRGKRFQADGAARRPEWLEQNEQEEGY